MGCLHCPCVFRIFVDHYEFSNGDAMTGLWVLTWVILAVLSSLTAFVFVRVVRHKPNAEETSPEIDVRDQIPLEGPSVIQEVDITSGTYSATGPSEEAEYPGTEKLPFNQNGGLIPPEAQDP